jgi:PucR family transcriptional regulator, purine catabolism regulatory protein
VTAARKREFPLFEVPYELPFIAITEKAFEQLVNERYEMLQRNMVGDVLAEALTGHLYPEELQARLRPFGIGEQVAVLAFATPDPTAAAAVLERILERDGVHNLVAIRAGLLCAVVDAGWFGNGRGTATGARKGDETGDRKGDGADRGDDPIALAGRLRGELAERVGNVAAAASRVAPTHSLRLSFHEARCALEAVRLQNGDAPEVASYKDLGAFQLLLSLQDDDALISYCRGVLGPVEQGEGEYGDELLRSLDVFIEHNGHWEKAASALYCHRHTLRYRIRRVEQLTGRDFSQARDRIEFWLALRGRELAR